MLKRKNRRDTKYGSRLCQGKLHKVIKRKLPIKSLKADHILYHYLTIHKSFEKERVDCHTHLPVYKTHQVETCQSGTYNTADKRLNYSCLILANSL